MPLPNIVSVALAWAQLVALVPVLMMYDNSEVEIMNSDIPDYQGSLAFMGQSLALAMVAISSVKKIFAVNESARKRKAIPEPGENPDFYFQLAEKLDRQQCVLHFICALTVRSRNNECLTSEQQLMVKAFGQHELPSGSSTNQSKAQNNLQRAAILGQTLGTNESTCSLNYPRCHWSVDVMSRMLAWIESLTLRDLRDLTLFTKKLIVNKAKGIKTFKAKDFFPVFISEIRRNVTQWGR